LKLRDRPVNRAGTPARQPRQGVLGGAAEGLASVGRQRTGQAADQQLSRIVIVGDGQDAGSSSSFSVDKMPRIKRPAVETDVCAESTLFNLFFGAVVAVLAQRLKSTGPEQGPIAAVGHDVIDHGRWHHKPLFEAELAERMNHELMPPDFLPACRAI
jgi:hypothetical protein